MAGSADASSASSASSAPLVVRTKLNVPLLREIVARPSLVSLLTQSRKLALVCAPAGWGKTTLVGAWQAADDRRFGWLTLDQSDNDPGRFWLYVVEALRVVEPGLGATVLPLLHAPGVDLLASTLPALLNELATLGQPIVLVLDDYHLIRSSEIHEGVEFLLEHLPPSLQLAIATRSEPPLPLARLRARGELTEIRVLDLSFSEEEAGGLLNGLLRLDLEPGAVRWLRERTEGWAAGLYLAGLSLRSAEDDDAFIASFAGDDRHLVDYLGEEVLSALPERVRSFLLHTSILDRFCGSLCDAVTGGDGSGELLAEIEHSNVFLVPLDAKRVWYRYHHLFGELLRQELQRADPEIVPELHRRAARWSLAAGDVAEAMHHLLAARDHGEAAELIARHWSSFVQANLDATVATWLEALPVDIVQADARLCIAAATTALSLNRPEEAAWWIAAIERAEAAGPFFDGYSSAASGAATTRAILAMTTGDPAGTVEWAAHAAAIEIEASPWRAAALDMHGIGLRWLGRPAEAEERLNVGLRASRSSGLLIMPVIYALGHLAGLSADREDWRSAGERAAEALGTAEKHGIGEHWVCGMARLVRGRVLDEAGDPQAAVAGLLRGLELARRGAGPLDVAWGCLALARARQGAGDAQGARVALREARMTLEGCPAPGPVLTEFLATTGRRLGAAPPTPRTRPAAAVEELSEREKDVLRLLATRLSQREIGAELYLSLNTVKTHTKNVFRKLGVSTRAEAVARARDLGFRL